MVKKSGQRRRDMSAPWLRIVVAVVALSILIFAQARDVKRLGEAQLPRSNHPAYTPTSSKPGAVKATGWKITQPALNHQIEGYASAVSVTPGSNLDLHISCGAKHYNLSVYRMGYYHGDGANLLYSASNLPCHSYAIPKPDDHTGLVNAEWPVSTAINIPSQWQSGVYLTRLTSSDGWQNYILFTVRTAVPRSGLLFIHAVNTDEAYNVWGGNSLYTGYTLDLKIKRAVKVSFNRPFAMPSVGNSDGSGDFLAWEYPMIRFLDSHGYKVDYATDVDVHEHPEILQKYKAVIITGHDEYWTKQMLDGYKSAVSHGVNLAVFAANTAYRPVRLETDPYTGQPDRILVDYKSVSLDPYAKNPLMKSFLTPNNWRSKPLNEPESELLGIAYRSETSKNGAASASLVVNDDSNWVFAGSGLKNGDSIPGLVGYEYDGYYPTLPRPSPVDLIFHSPLINIDGQRAFADSSLYTYPGGGQVFDAGTIQWAWGLDPANLDYSPKLVKVTCNILDRFGLAPAASY